MCVATRSRNQRSWLTTTAQPAKVKEAKPAGVSVDANADSGARAAREEYHNLGVEIPLRVADDSVVNEDEMIAWLDMLYAGHPSAQAALYRELADDTSDRYTTSGNERAMQTLRNTKGVRKDVLHLDEWVIFHTVDNDWLCSGRCRGPRWIYKHRKILLYRGPVHSFEQFLLQWWGVESDSEAGLSNR